MSAKPFLALTGLAALLAGLLVFEVQVAPSEDALLPPLPRRPPTTLASIPAKPSDNAQALVSAILARPLFRIDRHPPPAGAAPAASPAAALPRLTAIVVSGSGKSAIFAGGPDGKPLIVLEGGRVGPFVVQEIGAGQATVMGPDGPRTLHPAFGSAGAAGAASVAGAPGQGSVPWPFAVAPTQGLGLGLAGLPVPPPPSSAEAVQGRFPMPRRERQ